MPEEIKPIDLASVDHVLKTTRSVRLRLDFERPLPRAVIEEALGIALQAPTGANTQTWRFLVVTESARKQAIADYYRKAAQAYVEGRTAMTRTGVSMLREYSADDPRQRQREAMIKSGGHLLEHLEKVPAMIIPCIESRFEHEDVFTQASMWGSILPRVDGSPKERERSATDPRGPIASRDRTASRRRSSSGGRSVSAIQLW